MRCLEHVKRNVGKAGWRLNRPGLRERIKEYLDLTAFMPRALFGVVWSYILRQQLQNERSMHGYLRRWVLGAELDDFALSAAWRSSILDVDPGFSTYSSVTLSL